MLVVIEELGLQRIVEVRARAGATFSDLGDAAGLDDTVRWFVDGVRLEPGAALEGSLWHGSVIADHAAPGAVVTGGCAELRRVGGIGVGWSSPLRVGTNVLGSSSDVELRCEADGGLVAGRHCTITWDGRSKVMVTDLGSRSGTFVGGRRSGPVGYSLDDQIVRVGRSALRVVIEPKARTRSPGREESIDDGRVVFSRPPRVVPPSTPPLITVPQPEPAPSASTTPFSVAAIVAPLILGMTMVVVLGSARYAVFALLSPVLAVGAWLESRMSQRSAQRRHRAAEAARGNRFAIAVEECATTHAAHRWTRSPDIVELVRRMTMRDTRLWERRSGHDDAFRIAIGVGDEPWNATTGPSAESLSGAGSRLGAAADERSERCRTPGVPGVGRTELSDVPVDVRLGPGCVLGVVGPRELARGVVRTAVVSLAATSGPSDVRIVVVAEANDIREWGWAAWLPHTSAHRTGSPWILDADSAEAMLGTLDPSPDNRHGVLVVDAPQSVTGRGLAARRLWSRPVGPWGGVVIASTVDELPAECTRVVVIGEATGLADVTGVGPGPAVRAMVPAVLFRDVAVVAARSVARLDDPDLVGPADGLPDAVALGDIEGFDPELSARPVAGTSTVSNVALDAVVGVGPAGPFVVDLVRDGPHALIAGTTGSGKSELLRTLVTALAATHRPSRLNFVLIDYKGGAAFDAATRLPHVAGIVTDLDDRLAVRALVCLRAELTRRERVLRECAASDIVELPADRLARLVIVIDEFATLAAELPDFLEGLVAIAQRGRSLGMHLVLATQRPAGAVSPAIRANTNLRIALRVQDPADSHDVVGCDLAAHIGADRPGRAAVRTSHGAVVLVQTAHVCGQTRRGDQVATPPVSIGADPSACGPTTLDLVLNPHVRVEGEAGGPDVVSQRTSGASWSGLEPSPVWRPWPDPLPNTLDQATLRATFEASSAPLFPRSASPSSERQCSASTALVVGIADRPELQRWEPFCWRVDDGGLLVCGSVEAGAREALGAVMEVAAERWGSDVHFHVLELCGSAFGPLAAAPGVAGVVGGGDEELFAQVVRRSVSELDRRLVGPADANALRPRMMLVIDGLDEVLTRVATAAGAELVEHLRRVFIEGTAVGIHVAASSVSGALPRAWLPGAGQRWALGGLDPAGLDAFGVTGAGNTGGAAANAHSRIVGRGIDGSGVEFQLATFATTALFAPGPGPRPEPLRSVYDGVEASELSPVHVDDRRMILPVGLDPIDASMVALTVHRGDGLVVAGGPRTGVTSTLRLIATSLGSSFRVAVLARAPTGDFGAEATLCTSVDELVSACASADRTVVIVDDAHHFADERLAAVAAMPGIELVVAGGRVGRLRRFGHWTNEVRSSGVGLLLDPDLDLDGDLLGVRLDRRVPAHRAGCSRGRRRAGRGLAIVDGSVTPVQIADVNF